MRFSQKARVAWMEGVVNRDEEHASVCYGENPRAVALVAPDDKRGFTVQFLLKARRGDARADRILDAVRRELTFYLLEIIGPDSWAFVEYHCDTPANRRSIVHWSWHPGLHAGAEASSSRLSHTRV